MRRIEFVDEFRRVRRGLTGTLGLVPTMGYLHQGHLELVRRARAENDFVAVSIFVNPTQFGPLEDFARYPRDMDRDLSMLRRERVDLVWTPSVEEVYPPGFSTYVVVEQLTERLEGAARPGHFRGVATVVAKLFTVTEPHRAYFGQKDAQQALVIRRMTQDLNLSPTVVVAPTIREPDGLAMSSRNVYLSGEEREAAPALYRGLREAAARYSAGERSAEVLRAAVHATLAAQPLITPEYVSVADPSTLDELHEVSGRALLSLAARLGQTRLIDNLVIGPDGRVDEPL
jgi:pantoate--beta-alanine ligase